MMFASFFNDFLFMKNNKQWFESPRPDNFNLVNSLVQQQQQQDSLINNPNLNSPSSFPHHPLSPFTLFANPKQQQPNQNSFTINTEVKDKEIKDIISFSQVQDQSDELFTPPQKCEQKIQDQLSTARKEGILKERNPRKTRPKDKGLKGLSTKAYNALVQMKQGTYKDVAAKLLRQFGLNPNSQKQTNEEMNIKRRVYDALNVLIALGLLKKQGKKIFCEQKGHSNNKKERQGQQKIWLRQKIRMKKIMILQKREKLFEAQQKYKGIKKLAEHNISNKKSEPQNKYIPFPFIGLNAISWEVQSIQEEKVDIRFKTIVSPFGDIDSLRWL